MSRFSLDNSTNGNASVANKLLMLLKTRGPQQAADAGTVLGTTGEAARQQFVKMAKEGLVEAVSESRGVGRPVQMWQLTAAGHGRFPDAHADLTVQLLQTIRSQLGEKAIDLLISTRENDTRVQYLQALEDSKDLAERVERLAEIRTREGYMAEWQQQTDQSFLLIENHCPICAAATLCQGFCRAELNLFQEVLGAKVIRQEHILGDARRCAYLITQQ